MRLIKTTVDITPNEPVIIKRSESPSEFKGIPSKYKIKVYQDGELEGYYENQMYL